MALQQRNMALDMMKGIGILLMMMCHLIYAVGPVKQFVYSFHMPLFFLVAGYLAKDISTIASFYQYTIKSAKRLLLPYFATMLMLCAWGALQAFAKQDISYFLRHLFSMLSASADGWDSPWGLIYAGPMWFLVALFMVREFFGGMQLLLSKYCTKCHDEIVVFVSVILSLISVLAHPYMPSLPFCIMQALTALAFYAVGWYVQHHPIPMWLKVVCLLIWPVAIIYGGINIESCTMTYYPLSFIGACGGTYAIYLLCKGITKIHESLNSISITHRTFSPLAWCGIYSLPILCMHDIEMYSDIYYSIMCRLPFVCERAWGGVIAILFAWIIIRLPYLKNVYK